MPKKPNPAGLRLIGKGKIWNYYFNFQGTYYHGTTGHTKQNLAVAWLLDYRTRLKNEWDAAQRGVKKDPDITCGELLAAWKEVHKGANLARVSRDWKLHVPKEFKEKRALDVIAADLEIIRDSYLKAPSLRNAHYKDAIAANREILEQALLLKKGADWGTAQNRVLNVRQNRLLRARKVKELEPPKVALHTNTGANKLIGNIRSVFNWAFKTQRLPRVPFNPLDELVEQKAPKTFLTKDQVIDYLEEIDRYRNLQVMVMVRAMLYLALREDEARHMRWATFNADRTTYQPIDSKTGEPGEIPLPVPEDLRTLLALLREEVPAGCPWCCPGKGGVPHIAQITTKAIKRAGDHLGIKGLSPHRMRGSCATILARDGASAFVVKAMGRWTRMETALNYVQITQDDLRAAQAKTFGSGAEKN